MPKTQAYNPYEVRNMAVNRFRGISNDDNPYAVAPAYVGDMSSMISFRIAEISPQASVAFNEAFDERIYSGSRILNQIVVSAGHSVFYEEDDPDAEAGAWIEDTSYAADETRVAKGLAHPYMRRVFSGIDRAWIGLDQGKGAFYPGTGVHWCFSIDFRDNGMQPFDQPIFSESFEGRIYSGEKVSGYVTLASDNSIFVELEDQV